MLLLTSNPERLSVIGGLQLCSAVDARLAILQQKSYFEDASLRLLPTFAKTAKD
jgi:hypothetical protein